MKNRGFNLFLFAVLFLVIAAFGIELHYMRHKAAPFSTRLILLLILNLTVISLLTLMFFVAKSLARLYLERRHKVLGYRFKTKLVVILVVLTLIPATFLFVVASGLITNYIDRWFVPQIKQPLTSSIEIARTFYEIERQKTLAYANAFSAGKTFLGNYSVRRFTKIPKNPTETVKAAFEGKEGTEVLSEKGGDVIRAVVPEFRKGELTGVLVVESRIPGKITGDVEKIKDVYENYLAIESWKVPITMNYLLVLGFLTLIVVFMALWVALRISRGITDPIQNLALATERVAAGDLDTTVTVEREDEIGILVNSFNDMVRKLKVGKESLESAYLYLKNILDNINSGVIMLDTSGDIYMINGAACTTLGIAPAEVIHRNYRDLLSKIDSEELHILVSGIEGREFKPIKREVKATIDNKRVSLLVFITSLRDSEKYIGLLVVFDDLTDVMEAQKALTWQDVARKIAHEIKNPLTPIKLSTERMIKKWEHKDPDFDEVFHRSTKTIVKEVDSLKRLVDEFSKFGKMPEINKSPTDISGVIDEVVNLYKDYKGVQLNVSVPQNPPMADLDVEQFRRVMINIFDNAIQAMTNSGRIDVSLHFNLPDNKAFVEIADNGPGIRNEDKEKLFLPYFSTKRDGTGLGLAIAYRIIKEHKGYIRVRDNDPNGTIFTIEIPIKES
jgi:two-component system nitrogen regulation sensor histidine kinase NtrY